MPAKSGHPFRALGRVPPVAITKEMPAHTDIHKYHEKRVVVAIAVGPPSLGAVATPRCKGQR